MPRPRKYTARGTERLTKAERSEAIRLSWITRRGDKPAKTKKARHEIDETRSAAMKAAWRRRRREGTAPPKKPKTKKLTHAERSVIAQAAAALRRKRAKAAARLATKLANERKQAKLARQAAKSAEKPTASGSDNVVPIIPVESRQAA
jgi:DNA repair ATPase RecN